MEQATTILCTAPTAEVATLIATHLVENKLAACINIIRDITSIYTWQGCIEQSQEAMLIIKAKQLNYQAIEAAILKLHPYECPEIIALPIIQGHKNYLNWINNN